MNKVGRGKPVKPRVVENSDQRIGLTLRTLRLDRGITGTEMADGMQISAGMYDHYEAGRRRITWERLQQATWFLNYRGSNSVSVQPEAIALPSECAGGGLTVIEGEAA
ncbi:helix-turn-helix domain-containing protein [Glutamicibacter sp. NPDC087344]|uniref:helix-turn-helix domain-containing protein n=1 Tax=Glutamicibacter sp. NPDC087344 TaxID=3363994 RepID=UPI00382075E9